ncbi:hypothetical protein PM082_009616 [Marasmius tenuissimus]|nr:hypothetical protein PM082_009616 [Marasmius tenuissimus]
MLTGAFGSPSELSFPGTVTFPDIEFPSSVQPPSATHNTNVGLIAGLASTLGVLILLIGVICLILWRKKRKRNEKTTSRPSSPSSTPPAIIEPFPFSTTESPYTLASTGSRTSTKTGAPRATTPLNGSVINDPLLARQSPQIASQLTPESESQQPHTRTDGEPSSGSTEANESELSAMRAEVRAMRGRLAVLEAEVADQPPEYVSYSRSRDRL